MRPVGILRPALETDLSFLQRGSSPLAGLSCWSMSVALYRLGRLLCPQESADKGSRVVQRRHQLHAARVFCSSGAAWRYKGGAQSSERNSVVAQATTAPRSTTTSSNNNSSRSSARQQNGRGPPLSVGNLASLASPGGLAGLASLSLDAEPDLNQLELRDVKVRRLVSRMQVHGF